jgi:hypothetical protein
MQSGFRKISFQRLIGDDSIKPHFEQRPSLALPSDGGLKKQHKLFPSFNIFDTYCQSHYCRSTCTHFHRPHPQREALIYRVKVAREFLTKLEITP